MNEKTARQIEEMKKQTIGVEVEMNSITREKNNNELKDIIDDDNNETISFNLNEGFKIKNTFPDNKRYTNSEEELIYNDTHYKYNHLDI